MRNKRKAVARVGIIFLVALILAISIAAFYIFYFPTYHSTSNPDTMKLQPFTLNLNTSTLSGTVSVESNSLISTLGLYINGTYVGSFNYSEIKLAMTTLVGNYPDAFSIAYSASPASMPMMANISLAQNKAYMITMIATFDDGSHCNATTIVHT